MRIQAGFATLLCFLCAILWSAGTAWAQQVTPTGIDVDAKGVLRSRTTDPDPRLAELWKNAKNVKKDAKLLYVSLPRLLSEARRLLESEKPLTDEIRYLGGMTKLEYVFVYPDDKDLVIAGPAEPFDSKDPYRPLGQITARPVLQLEDLVTALRAFAGERKPGRIGCDIQLTKESQDRVSKEIKRIGTVIEHKGLRAAAAQVAEAGGPLPVIYYGVGTDTRFALVCVESDYRLKQLVLGLMPSPVSKVHSFLSMLSDKDEPHRFSLESNYEALLVSPTGDAFQLRGRSLKVNGGLLRDPKDKPAEMAEAARHFIEQCNQSFDELMRHIVCFADLDNLGDLLVLAALVFEDKLAVKAGWDLAWILDPKGWPAAKLTAPQSALTLCNYANAGKLIFVSGGVWMNPAECTRNRERAERLGEKAQHSAEGGWSWSR